MIAARGTARSGTGRSATAGRVHRFTAPRRTSRTSRTGEGTLMLRTVVTEATAVAVPAAPAAPGTATGTVRS
ncbi:hypothetical protein KPATCC21470_1299 [Kitasatospora purpeofusca]